jgi:PhnB protein
MTFYPRLPVRDADAAIAFYCKALGAELVERFAYDDVVVHALLRAGDAVWGVKEADEFDTPNGTLLALYVDDPDAVGAALEANGATARFPIQDHDYGERAGRFTDPFGHQWMVACPLDVQPEAAESSPST